jgi:Rod binding domain-containing protein
MDLNPASATLGSIRIDNPAMSALKARADSAKASSPGIASRRAATGRAEDTAGRPAIDKKSELYAQCEQFESIFVKMMLDTMKKSVEKSGLMDGGMAEDIFQDMLYDEYALKMSRNASFGLADQAYLQLSGTAAARPAVPSAASAAAAYAAS